MGKKNDVCQRNEKEKFAFSLHLRAYPSEDLVKGDEQAYHVRPRIIDALNLKVVCDINTKEKT